MRAVEPKPRGNIFAEIIHAYRLRWKRRRLLFRVLRKRRQLDVVADRTDSITADMILGFSCVRNEATRLPYFLKYYRSLGVDHFLIVDNDSDDGSAEFLAQQPDVSLWRTPYSYRLSRFGVDWLGWLQLRYGRKHWCLTVDADELLVYPSHDTRDLKSLTQHLDAEGRVSFGALMIDLYPKGAVTKTHYIAGDDPLDILTHFDHDNHRSQWHAVFGNLWIQGGVRERVFFKEKPERAPTLNKIPLIKWQRGFAYVSSTHQALPTRVQDVFSEPDRTRLSGALLHTKFLPVIAEKSAEELTRRQHFENSALYGDYHKALTGGPDLWHENSCAYMGWEQLVYLGLVSNSHLF